MMQSPSTIGRTTPSAASLSTQRSTSADDAQATRPTPWTRACDLASTTYPPFLTAIPLSAIPNNPFFRELDRVLKEGDPDAIASALTSSSSRGDVQRHHLRSHVFKTVDARNDETASACLAKVTAHYGVTPSHLLAQATLSGDADLARIAIRIDPSSVTLSLYQLLRAEMPQIARLALIANPALARAVGWDEFRQLMVQPLVQAAGVGQLSADDLSSRLEALLRAVPIYAGHIASHIAGHIAGHGGVATNQRVTAL